MAPWSPPPSYELTTPRLVIRTAVPSDAEAIYAFNSDPANLPLGETQIEPGVTVEKLVPRIGRRKAMQEEGKNAFFVLALRETGELVGNMGFNCFEPRSVAEPGGADPAEDDGPYLTDIGVMIDHRHWRKGYATEVLCASVEYAFGRVGCRVVRVETGTANEPWRAFMKAAGLDASEEHGEVSYGKGIMGWIYKFGEADWEKAKAALKEKGKWPL